MFSLTWRRRCAGAGLSRAHSTAPRGRTEHRCLLVHGTHPGHPAQKSGRTQVYPASSESLGEGCGDIDGPIPLASRLCGRGCFLRARRRQADRRVFLVLSHPCSSRCDGVARRVTSACFAILGPGVSSCRDRPSTGYFYSSPRGEHRARDLLPTALPPLSCCGSHGVQAQGTAALHSRVRVCQYLYVIGVPCTRPYRAIAGKGGEALLVAPLGRTPASPASLEAHGRGALSLL